MLRLTNEQRELVDEYQRHYKPMGFIIRYYPSVWRAALKAKMTMDEMRSACWYGATIAATRYRPDHPSGTAFSTYANRAAKDALANEVRKRLLRPFVRLNPNILVLEEGDRVEGPQMIEHVWKSMTQLPDRWKLILELRYGGEGWTLEKVSKVIGVSKERVRQLEAKAINHLREVLECPT